MVDEPHYPGAPRWAKVLGIALGTVIILFLIALVIGKPHGPAMHAGDDLADSSGSKLQGQAR